MLFFLEVIVIMCLMFGICCGFEVLGGVGIGLIGWGLFGFVIVGGVCLVCVVIIIWILV